MREICNKIDYLAEAIGLLTHIGSGNSYMELKQSIGKKRNLTFESKKHVFEVLVRIEKAAQKYFSKEIEDISYYFGIEEGAVRSCGEVLILWDGFSDEPYRSLDDVKQYFETVEESEYITKFGNYLQGYTDTLGDESSFEKLDESIKIITYLMNMEISQDEKWKIQTLFLKRKEHFPRITSLIQQSIEFLKGYEEELSKLVWDFCDYWDQILAKQTLTEYMQRRIAYHMPPNPFGYRIRPSIMIPNVIGFHIDMDEEGNYKKQDEDWIGILFGDELDVLGGEKENIPDIQQIVRTMKLLSDKSKFEILCRIHKEPAYGKQLAQEMKLTSATISHHMSALIAEGLVTMQMEEKKVYYQQDKENLRRILDRCREVLGL